MNDVEKYIEIILRKAKEFEARKIILFGSALENPEYCNDIDLACDIPGLGMFLFASKLEEELNKPVDVIPINDKDPFMSIVNKYGRVIYDKG
jgi:hypothetical protein